jgi:uncharacterized protein (TIGR02594 family)
MNRTKQAQQKLKELGYYNDNVDGIFGRNTINAIKQFQKSKGLVVDGILGPNTISALKTIEVKEKGYDTISNTLDNLIPWYEYAETLFGTHERKYEKKLIGWAKRLVKKGVQGVSWYTKSSIPWCGLFVAHCISVALPEEVIIENPLWARGWMKFGAGTSPKKGAIMVFKRGNGGHVGFYASEDSRYYHILGGNQSDSVTIMKIAKNRFLGARWPVTAASIDSGATFANTDYDVSENEA